MAWECKQPNPWVNSARGDYYLGVILAGGLKYGVILVRDDLG